MTDRVDVKQRSLVQEWQRSGAGEMWIQLSGSNTDEATFSNAVADPDDPYQVVVCRISATNPAGHVALIEPPETKDELLAWADRYAQRLQALGVTGVLKGVQQAEIPEWVFLPDGVPSAFFTWSWDVDVHRRNRTYPEQSRQLWKLDQTMTATVAEFAADFVKPGGPSLVLQQGAFYLSLDVEDDKVAEFLGTAIVSDDVQAGILRFDDESRFWRSAQLAPWAQTVFQQADPTLSWSETIDILTGALTARSNLLDYGFIRPAHVFTGSWRQGDLPLRYPHVRGEAVRSNPHLIITHVIDAHGVQVLTTAQTERIRHQQRWNISDLGNDRQLVTAPDLAPWYSNPLPEPDVLADARDDFADILLTPEVLAANPPPWS